MDDEENFPCEYCPNSRVLCQKDGSNVIVCDLSDDVDPEDVPGSRCVYFME